MRLAILLLPFMLAGCLATPVQRHFPEVPSDLKEACPALKEVDQTTTKLSDVVSVVSANYGQYQECKIKVDGWIDWYNTQRKIFEEVK
jgi:hypothetical protein